MKIILFLFGILIIYDSYGQVIFVDPAVTGAQAAGAIVINEGLDETNKKLSAIETGQLAVSAELLIVNDMQKKIYEGLSEVTAILSNLSDVREITRIAEGIGEDVKGIRSIAEENPAFLLFAEAGADLFKERSAELALEVSTFVLQGGKDNLMDAGERAKLLANILKQMIMLRSYSSSMYRSMYNAQNIGLTRALNPFQNYVDDDKEIVDNILKDLIILE